MSLAGEGVAGSGKGKGHTFGGAPDFAQHNKLIPIKIFFVHGLRLFLLYFTENWTSVSLASIEISSNS